MRRQAVHPLGQFMSALSTSETTNKGDRAKTQAPVSSVGEDRAILLGFTMIGFSLLTYFLFGIVLVAPYLKSIWTEESNCTMIQADFRDEWGEVGGDFGPPCLRVTVNLSQSRKPATLHYNEDTIHEECFYIPKHNENKSQVLEEAQRIRKYLQTEINASFPCHSSLGENPSSAILTRKYDGWLVIQYMCWPTLMLAGGAGTISLVRLNQWLSHMVAQFGHQGSGKTGLTG
ncbi:hypothetical protein AAFF_G00228630 [Aldrovandia affinis]|uniref:Uncharacterized protein n=1 Tax=Aldrovandia affinis TaxID=143900 RepID=A0AAD7SWH1_9TELE|nr:hypothetical protein AAFF_G00228630 [Aldrovandia affinis]